MKKRTLIVLLCISMILGMFAGCGKNDEVAANGNASSNAQVSQDVQKTEEKPSNTVKGTDGVLTYAIEGDTGNTLNALTVSDRWGMMTKNLVHAPLVRGYSDGSLENVLAESVEASADGLSYTIKLKQGLVWSDGKPVTAEDVVFTIDAYNAIGKTLYVNGQPVVAEAVDELTVTIALPSVSASSYTTLTTISPIPKHVFEGRETVDINMLEEDVIGCGPYILEDYVTGQYLKFKANPDYALGEAKIPTIIFQIIEKSDTSTLALQKGEIDIWNGSIDMLDPYIGNDAFNIKSFSEGRVAYVKLNRNTEAMKNPEYRKGILYALDRTEIMTAAYSDPAYFELGYTFLPYDNVYYCAEVEKYEQDIEKAKSLVAGGPTTLKIAYIESDNAQTNMALAIQAELKAIGVNLELCGVNQGAYTGIQYNKEDTEYDMLLGGYVAGSEPNTYSLMFATTKNNTMNFNSPEIDELFLKGDLTLDSEERYEIYAEAQKLVAEDATFYPLGTNLRTIVTNARVGGLDDAKFTMIYTFGDYSKLTLN